MLSLPLLILFVSLTLVVHAEDQLCLTPELKTSINLATQAQEILGNVDPELKSLCQGLIAKSDEEMQNRSDIEYNENLKMRLNQWNQSPFATSKEQYCSRTAKEMIRNLCMVKGRLGLDNTGGLFGSSTGVCWWNSMFHRKVNYLTYYNPQKNTNYSEEEVRDIIERIANFKTTSIDGYDTFQNFINDPKYPKRAKVLQKYLQKEMGKSTLKFEWLKGLKGKRNVGGSIDSPKMEKQRRKQLAEISKIKEQLQEQSKVPYMMVQVPGMGAHAFLVYDYIELKDASGNKAYKIRVQDSLYQSGGVYVQDSVFVFDEETGQWYDEKNYKTLAENRLRPFDLMEKNIKAENWTLWNDHNDQMDSIDEGFRKECGHSLFK